MPSLDEWVAAASLTVARRQDITLADPLELARRDSDRDELSFEDSFGGGEWQAFDLDESMEKEADVSDVEVAREADGSLPAFDESMMAALNAKDDSVLSAKQPEFSIEAFDELPEVDNGLEAPLSPRSSALDISSDLNVSINNDSRLSLGLGDEGDDAADTRPKKKRKIGRDSVTELSSAFLKKVGADSYRLRLFGRR